MVVPAVGLVAKVVLLVEVVQEEITKVEVLQDKTKAYDRWGCPGAIRETRDVLESLSYCSRTSICC